MSGRRRCAVRSEPRLSIEHVPIDRLRPDPANPRVMPEHERDALDRSLAEFGFVEPIVVRRSDNRIIGGHMRMQAAIRRGHTDVPVVYVDVTDGQARVLALALNRIHGQWDDTLLARLLADLQSSPDVDIALTGFADDEIQRLLKSLDTREKRDRPEMFDLEAALAQNGPTRATLGDVWRLGDHRIRCGDATDGAQVESLVADTSAVLAFTDPPYNVGLGDHGGQQRGQRRRRLANDALPSEEWEAFVRGWTANLLASVDGAIYVCMSTKEWPLVSRMLAELGGHWSDTNIWAKDRFVLGRADYQRQYEPIWYGWREGAKRHWCGDRDQGDIWEITRPAVSEWHPTTKPVELAQRAIDNSSKPGDVVLDLFLGSGTTLIAAERTGRSCHAMELDPHYVDVALARWEAFTDETAEKIATNGDDR